MAPRYVVGIDLGTTNCALAYVDLKATGPELQINILEVPQLVGPGRLGQRQVLPSFLYLPGEFEFEGDLALPWDEKRRYVVGVFARDQGALVPTRLVSSAKSWLCHGGVDREAPILPWGAGEEVPKVSPLEASARYLQHLREAWNYLMAREDPEASLEKQLVIVTVPASFDEVARELTLKAAQMAGLPEVVLLEEPVAALYAWLSQHEKDWDQQLQEGEKVLVCDVGGGTSDFTVVDVRRGPEGLHLERVAVGDHILLGGDNIDLALARLAERKLPQTRLDFARFQTLTFLCRELKECLLAPDGPEEDAVRLPGRGRALIAETLVAKVNRQEVLDLILKEFLPEVTFGKNLLRVESVPKVMREWGLPFARDVAITRHLAAFLYRHEIKNVDVILFNGGALKPPLLRERLRQQVASWFGREDLRELETVSLDLAVAVGAAYYGLVRQGLGIRVGGGLPRAYYLGLDSGKAQKAVCLVPKGTHEGEKLVLPQRFKIITNRPVKFPIYTSSLREDPLGEIVTIDEEQFASLPPLTTALKFGRKSGPREITVGIEAHLTEIGVLEIFCQSTETPHRWRLQFALRERMQEERQTPEGVLVEQEKEEEPLPVEEEKIEEAKKLLEQAFLSGQELERLAGRLEALFEMERNRWPLALLRLLADQLLPLKEARKKNAQFEARWLNLTGFTLRPGYGDPLDPFRVRQLWSLYFEGPSHRSDKGVLLEWWIFWRRIAGGLNTGQQEQLFSKLRPFFLPSKKQRVPKVSPTERREMWLCIANLERLAWKVKANLAEALLNESKKKLERAHLFVFSRLLARELLYGPANAVIPAAEAQKILPKFLDLLRKKKLRGALAKAALEALINVARLTGDRTRDLPQALREQIAQVAQELDASEEVLKPLFEPVPFQERERAQLFGESLPIGLKLAA